MKNQRKLIKVSSKPEDSDLDIMAVYKSENIDCILTTNYKHFIELGRYLDIFIEGIESKEQKERREANKMIRDFFWKRKKFK